MAESLVPGPSHFEVEIAIAKLKKKYKSPDSDQILAEPIQAGGKMLLSAIHKLILFLIIRNFLINGRNLLLYRFTKRVTKLTVKIIVGFHNYQLHTKCYRISSYDSVRREVLYNIHAVFAVPMKLVRLIKMCLNETAKSV
jgi:hypothetical protein